MKEIWKECCEGWYEVSNLGRVRRAKSRIGKPAIRMLKMRVHTNGYYRINSAFEELSSTTMFIAL